MVTRSVIMSLNSGGATVGYVCPRKASITALIASADVAVSFDPGVSANAFSSLPNAAYEGHIGFLLNEGITGLSVPVKKDQVLYANTQGGGASLTVVLSSVT